nr:MASE1 domain-containing protein [Dyella soli]
MFVGGVFAQIASALLWSYPSGSPVLWIPGGLLFAALLTAHARCWPACLLGFLLGLVAFGVLTGSGPAGMLMLGLPVVVLVPATVWFLLRIPSHDDPIDRWPCLFGFMAFGMVALPLLSAAVVGWLNDWFDLQDPRLQDWQNVALSHALGYTLFVPAWASIVLRGELLQKSRRGGAFDVVFFGLALAFTWYIWKWFGELAALQPVLLLMPAPLIVWSAMRYHLAGVCVVVLAIAMMAIYISETGQGPFYAGSVGVTTRVVQVWTMLVAALSLLLGQAMEQLSSIRMALNDTHVEIRKLAGQLVATQEQERARIARELHDDVNQRLASASILLSMLKRKPPEAAREGMTRLQGQLYELSDAIRQLSHDLHPSMLKQTGLADALRRLCSTERYHNGPAIDVDVRGDTENLPEDVSLGLYRAAQEGLSNAIRHAFAQQIVITLEVDSYFASLTVEDDGRGFDANYDNRGASKGLGLVSIDDRARLLNGKFVIYTGVGKGARLCIQIPLRQHYQQERRLHA